MIDVDISNIWGNIEFHSLIQMESRLTEAAAILKKRNEISWCGWTPFLEHAEEIFPVVADTASEMMSHSTALVVIGTAMVNQYIRAAVTYNTNPAADRMKLYYAGDSLSSESMQQAVSEVQNTDFSVLVVSRITTIEEAVALRKFKWLLNRKYGPEQALGRIYFAVSKPCFKVLNLAQNPDVRSQIAFGEKEKYFPAAACMIPIAAAGGDPELIADGARRAAAELENPDMENPVWLYTAARVLLSEQGIGIEELHVEEAQLEPFGNWCCQSFAEAQQGSGNWITSILNPYAGYAYRAHTFETVLIPEERTGDSVIELDLQNADGLNYLAGARLSQIEECVADALSGIKAEKQFPAILIRTGKHSLRLFGYLTYFFLLAAGLSAKILKTEDDSGEADVSVQHIVLNSLEQKFKS